MAEIINKTCSSELKKLTKSAVVHFIKGMNGFEEWSNNHLANFVIFATYVHHNNSRFTLSLIDQQQRGVPFSEVQFVMKKTLCVFYGGHERHHVRECCS